VAVGKRVDLALKGKSGTHALTEVTGWIGAARADERCLTRRVNSKGPARYDGPPPPPHSRRGPHAPWHDVDPDRALPP
jgi:hypothetical protein